MEEGEGEGGPFRASRGGEAVSDINNSKNE